MGTLVLEALQDSIASKHFLTIEQVVVIEAIDFMGPIMDGDPQKIWDGKILDIESSAIWPFAPQH